jgi:hypothetical protein
LKKGTTFRSEILLKVELVLDRIRRLEVTQQRFTEERVLKGFRKDNRKTVMRWLPTQLDAPIGDRNGRIRIRRASCQTGTQQEAESK